MNNPYKRIYQDFESSDGMTRYIEATTTEKKSELELEDQANEDLVMTRYENGMTQG